MSLLEACGYPCLSSFLISTSHQLRKSKGRLSYRKAPLNTAIPTKKDSRAQAIRLEVAQAERSLNNKSVDKVLRMLQKSLKFLDSEELVLARGFFSKVFLSKKISQSVKDKARAFLNNISEGERTSVQSRALKKDRCISDELSAVVNLKDFDEKCRKLQALLDSTSSPAERFKIMTVKLLTLVYRHDKQNLSNIHSLVQEICELHSENESLVLDGIDLKAIFTKQVSAYICAILAFATKEDATVFMDVASLLLEYDRDTVSKKILEFKYFVLEDFAENDDDDFRLLYLVKKEDYASALSYFGGNRTHLLISEERSVLESIYILGSWCFDSRNYEASFEMLQRCYYNGYAVCETRLMILCCFLNVRVRNERFFEHFLDVLSTLENNVLLLESGVPKNEVVRAFFLLTCLDHAGCERILRRIEPGIDCSAYLEDYVMQRVACPSDSTTPE